MDPSFFQVFVIRDFSWYDSNHNSNEQKGDLILSQKKRDNQH